jgi:hypothetical protein
MALLYADLEMLACCIGFVGGGLNSHSDQHSKDQECSSEYRRVFFV